MSGLGVKCERWRRNVRFATQTFCVPFVAIFSITQWCFRAATVAAKTVLSSTGESVSRDSVHCADKYLLIILPLTWVLRNLSYPFLDHRRYLEELCEVYKNALQKKKKRFIVYCQQCSNAWSTARTKVTFKPSSFLLINAAYQLCNLCREGNVFGFFKWF